MCLELTFQDRRRAKELVEAQRVPAGCHRPGPRRSAAAARRVSLPSSPGQRRLRGMARRKPDAANAGRLEADRLTYKMTRKAEQGRPVLYSRPSASAASVSFFPGHRLPDRATRIYLSYSSAPLSPCWRRRSCSGRQAERAAFGDGGPAGAAAPYWTTSAGAGRRRRRRRRTAPGMVTGPSARSSSWSPRANLNRGEEPAYLAAEKKKMNRIVADVPVHDLIVGTGEGQVELKKLRTTMLKLPRRADRPPGDDHQRPAAGPGRPDEQHAAAEGSHAEGHEAAEGRTARSLDRRRSRPRPRTRTGAGPRCVRRRDPPLIRHRTLTRHRTEHPAGNRVMRS